MFHRGENELSKKLTGLQAEMKENKGSRNLQYGNVSIADVFDSKY